MKNSDKVCMLQALELARQAIDHGDIPIGALVVDEYQQIIGSGYNQTEQLHTQTAHAELIALQAASAARGDWRLEGCTLYVTLQPCYMCWSAIALSRVSRMVYATDSPLYGFDPDTSHELPIAYRTYIPHTQKGPCSQEAQAMLDGFFKARRVSP